MCEGGGGKEEREGDEIYTYIGFVWVVVCVL
jgi:hypothetical protein